MRIQLETKEGECRICHKEKEVFVLMNEHGKEFLACQKHLKEILTLQKEMNGN